jgi:ankyrin repeat protein
MLVTHTGAHYLLGAQGLEERDIHGQTALSYAAEEGHGEVVALLLGKGAQASTRDNNSMTPLMKACDNGHLDVVRMLVQHTGGGALDARDRNKGWTALHGAAYWGHEEMVRLLLFAGADPTVTDNEGRTALDISEEVEDADEEWRDDRARCMAVFKVSEPTCGGLCSD